MRLILPVVLLVLSSVPAAAQNERIGIGASVTYVRPQSDDLTRAPLTLRPLVRLQPGEGWGFAGAFNWYDTDIDDVFPHVVDDLGRLEVKPLMGGVGYTIRNGRLRTTFSVVAGPVWNRLKMERSEHARAVENADQVTLGVRPGVGASIRVAPRLDLTAFGGYLVNRPTFYFSTIGDDPRNRWNADALVLSVGVVVAIF